MESVSIRYGMSHRLLFVQINRLQGVLKEREDTVASQVLSISNYERKINSMKSQLDSKEELV